jgi:hypothetical protein
MTRHVIARSLRHLKIPKLRQLHLLIDHPSTPRPPVESRLPVFSPPVCARAHPTGFLPLGLVHPRGDRDSMSEEAISLAALLRHGILVRNPHPRLPPRRVFHAHGVCQTQYPLTSPYLPCFRHRHRLNCTHVKYLSQSDRTIVFTKTDKLVVHAYTNIQLATGV